MSWPVFAQFLDDGIVLGVVLEAAAGVDRAGDAEPVELAHEMARRVDLIIERQLRPLGQRRVEDRGIRLGQQKPGRIAVRVAHDLASRRLRRVLGVADRAQRGAVEKRAIIEMQEEDRRVGRDRVELLDRRQALLGELMLGEAADHAHPLRRRRDRHLPLQHGHGVGETAHAIPAQLHVEVQSAADDVQVVVDQARQRTSGFQVDDRVSRVRREASRPCRDRLP